MVEKRLREATALQDVQARKRLINELARRPEETLTALIPLLRQSDEPMLYMALEVIQAIGYPHNAEALEALIELVANGQSSLQMAAFQNIVQMGIQVLPVLVELQREHPQQILMAANEAYQLFFQSLDSKDRADPEMRKRISLVLVQALAQHPDEVLPAIVYILTDGPKCWLHIAIRTLSVIGYPKNKPFLPLLIAQAASNDVGVFEAIPALSSLGPEIVVPYLLEALYHDKTANYQWIDVKDICTALSQLGKEYATPCGPLLCHRFSQLLPIQSQSQFPPVQLQEELEERIYLIISVLKVIGTECALYAFPVLLDLLAEAEGSDEMDLPIREFIKTFDRRLVEQYTLIL